MYIYIYICIHTHYIYIYIHTQYIYIYICVYVCAFVCVEIAFLKSTWKTILSYESTDHQNYPSGIIR